MSTATVAFIVLATVCCTLCAGAPGHMRGAPSYGVQSDRTVTTEAVQSSLREALNAVVGEGSEKAAEQLARAEASMAKTFQALPKNSMGRLAPRAVRHIIHNYFAKEHGWLINGLENHGMQQNVSEVHEVDILQDKAPALVEALLESRRKDRGLSLSDVAVMATALERLIFDESVALLRSAYALNEQTVVNVIDSSTLHEVLSSYLMLFEMGWVPDPTDVHRHRAMKEAMAESGQDGWPTLLQFGRDAASSFDFDSSRKSNPFVERTYRFSDASQIVETMTQDYGKWQNTECRQMREELSQLDPEGSGLVPLQAFYSQSEKANYQFTESTDYLRSIGALDVDSNSVRIANYIVGPSNCIAKSTYYSVCCLSECESIMNELEGRVKAPAVDPARLLSLVVNLTSSSASMRVSHAAAAARLQDIAAHNGGEVPLHGRLFAEFLHVAFPTDCPYPHIAEDITALTAERWMQGKAKASDEERRRHIEAADAGSAADSPCGHDTCWSSEEVLPVIEPQKAARGLCSGALRTIVMLSLVAAALRAALSALRSAAFASLCVDKDKGFVLPVRL